MFIKNLLRACAIVAQLLTTKGQNMQKLPEFSKIEPTKLSSQLQNKLTANRQLIKTLIKEKKYNWDNLVQPLEDMEVELNNFWSIIAHLHNVMNTDALRKAYEECLPLLTEYSTEMGLNRDLYAAFLEIRNSKEYADFSKEKKKVIDNTIRDFKLAGVALEGKSKERYQQIQLKLANLTNQFEQNVMDSTDAWSKLITNEKELAGIPELAKQGFKQKAKDNQKEGWLISLDFPSYYTVITYADNRELRKKLYIAYCTRASDCGPHDKKYDNSQIMYEILQLRDEEAKLLGYQHFGEYSLATKMAKNSEAVLNFLYELAESSKPIATEEWKKLREFAEKKLQMEEFFAWDIAYASEKLRLVEHDVSQEELRPYFEIDHVINGLFEIAQKLFQITIVQDMEVMDVWHPDVTYYEIFNNKKELIANFYLDLYARTKKRGGAWMDDCRSRHQNTKKEMQLPIAYLTCNFTPPLENKPALLTHDEVITLFHEFGHGLHHMLTQVKIASISGINGVAWDAVEFPSQFMEYWCWNRQSLNLIACHYVTKEPLPDALLNKLQASKNFQTGMHMLRQIEFALFDFRIHKEFNGSNKIQKILNEIRHKIAVVQPPEFNRFQHGFSHIFGGGYAAGYYSYKWAEVLAADAFSLFEHTNIFDPILGERFRQCILEKGGSEDALDLFIQFKGSEPSVSALLKEAGIS